MTAADPRISGRDQKALERMRAGLDEITPLENLILEITALIGAPFSLRRLLEVGRSMGAGKELDPVRLGSTLDSLLAKGFLVEVEEEFQCLEALADHVASRSMANGRAGAIVKKLLKFDPWRSHMQRSSESSWRHFRYSIYSGDFNQAKLMSQGYQDVTGQRVWGKLGRMFLESESFLRFHQDLALILARETLMESINGPFPANPALEALHQLIRTTKTTERDRFLYGHQLLMRGRNEDLVTFLETFDSPLLSGCRKILDGDISGLEDLEFSLRLNVSFPSFTALFLYIVALISKLGFASPLVAKEVARAAYFRVPFLWLLEVKNGGEASVSREMQAIMENPPDGAFPHLCAILYWAGLDQEKKPDPVLLYKAREYARSGYAVFANWLEYIAGKEDTQTPSLFRLLAPEERWRSVLTAVSAWAVPPAVAAAEVTSSVSERLVWQIEPFETAREVEPRIQKQKKGGGWSSGRLLALDEVFRAPPSCADSHDFKVFEALEKLERAKPRFAYVGKHEMLDAAMLALSGHPRVSLKTAPEDFIELTEKPVSVHVIRGEGHLEVRLEPQPTFQPMVAATLAESGRVHLHNITPRHIQLGRMIGSQLKVPQEGEAELRATLTRLASSGLVLRSDIELATDVQEVPPDLTLIIRLSPQGDGVSVQVRVAPLGAGGPLLPPGDGSPVVAGTMDGQSVQTKRDLILEKERMAGLALIHPALVAADFMLKSATLSLEFLEAFAQVQADGFRFEWPEGGRFSVTRTLGSSDLGQRLRSGPDWFALGGELQVDDDMVLSLSELLKHRRESESRFIPLADGKFLALTSELERYLERLDRLALRQTGDEVMLHPLVGMAVLDENEVEMDAGWQVLKKRLEVSKRIKPMLPHGLQGELRSYQKEGFNWMVQAAHWGVGVCLADDMGLGKTVQILALLLARAEDGPALVVAPTSVGWNWLEEANRFAPALRVILLAESDRSAVLGQLGPGDVLVVSYGLLVNETEALTEIFWNTLVLDEAQAIKNSNTQRARAACGLQAEFRIAATGTPIENHLEEMWALFKFLNPGLLGTRKGFQQRFAATDEAQQDLSRLVRPFILRRTKDQVLTELPPRTEIVEKVQLSEPERALYETLRRQAVKSLEGPREDYLSVLAQLTKLRRACCHPRLVMPNGNIPSSKLARFHELVEELVDNGHRALVFSQFTSYLAILREELDARGVTYAYLDGSTAMPARKKAVKSFQDGEGDLFLISLKAGGTGLNLTGADYVIHLDPWWNPAVEDQASDRAHRMGQLRPVTVYRLVTVGTIEEQIVELHHQKRDLAQRLLDGTEGSAKMSTADLMALLQQVTE